MPYIHTHTKTMPDGRKIDILKLHTLLANRPVSDLALEKIKTPSRSKRSGFSKKRFTNTDTNYPLIIDENRFLIDGRHRFFKLLDSGVQIAQVQIASTKDIEEVMIPSTPIL